MQQHLSIYYLQTLSLTTYCCVTLKEWIGVLLAGKQLPIKWFAVGGIVALLLLTISTTLTQVVYAQNVDSLEDTIGAVAPPPGTRAYSCDGEICIILFISNLIKLSTAIAGVWTLFMFVVAGYTMINSGGKKEAYSKASSYFTHAIIGFTLIISAYTIAGIIGFVFYGDATFIINPRLPAL